MSPLAIVGHPTQHPTTRDAWIGLVQYAIQQAATCHQLGEKQWAQEWEASAARWTRALARSVMA